MRSFIIGLFVFASLSSVSTQVEVSDFAFGFQISPTLSRMSTDNNRINHNGSNLGLRLGTSGEYTLSENYSLTAGVFFAFNQGGQLLYEQGGTLLPNSDLSMDMYNEGLPNQVDIRYKMQFLEIPVGFKMRTNQIGNMRYFAHFPEFALGFNTNAKANLSGGTQSTYLISSDNENINNEVPFLRIFWSASIGGEYQIGGGTYLVGGLGYHSNFGDILKGGGTRNDGSRDHSTARIHSLVFKLGVMF